MHLKSARTPFLFNLPGVFPPFDLNSLPPPITPCPRFFWAWQEAREGKGKKKRGGGRTKKEKKDTHKAPFVTFSLSRLIQLSCSALLCVQTMKVHFSLLA